MILGITHDHDGRVTLRLSVSTKLAIGLPPSGDRNYPTKLDHFVFLRKKRTAQGVEWELDPDLMKLYGTECREVRIVLIDDDIENVFPTSYAWWTAVERKCWGDGGSATRRTGEKPSGQPWTPCGNGCPELTGGLCKPSGDLRFVLAAFPRLGSVCRLHTSSYRSIRQIHSALQEIQGFTGGRLAGLTAQLVVRPEETAYFDAKEKRRKSTTIWALSLEVDGKDMRKLAANLTENARVFAETRQLLDAGKVLEVVEDEAEEAAELAAEFYTVPATDTSAAQTGVTLMTGAQTNASKTKSSGGAPSPYETQPGRSESDGPESRIRRPQRKAALPATNGTAGQSKPANSTTSSTQPEAVDNAATTLGGVVGPLEPDASGSAIHKTPHGTEYVVFKISRNGSPKTVYCNRPERVGEIAKRQGREAVVEVTVVARNGQRHYLLKGFLEG